MRILILIAVLCILIFSNSAAFSQDKPEPKTEVSPEKKAAKATQKENEKNSEKKHGIFAGISEKLTIEGYADTYVSYDNDKGDFLRKFSAIAPYRDEFRMNMVMLAMRYSSKRVRGTVAIHFGDISKINWPAAPNDYLQYIQEGNVGVSSGKNVWIDGGYFLTHIGGEGIIPMYNYFQSLALCTYYEPVYQSGIRLSYTGDKFYGAAMVLNGYNVFTDNNKNKSAGLQLGYNFGKVDITYNNIIGNEMPAGTEGKVRIYNNLVLKFYPGKKLDIILCGDFSTQEKSQISDSTATASMFSAFLSLRYKPAKKFSMSLRGEIFQDKDGFLSGVITDSDGKLTGLKASGVSFGVEYNPVKNSYFRLETRYLMTDSKQKIFFENNNTRVEVILSGGVAF